MHEQGTPQYRLGLWRATFSTKSYIDLFDKEEDLVWSYVLPTTVEGVIDRVRTKSYITTLEGPAQAQVVETVKRILDEEPRAWVNEADGVFAYPYKTTLIVMKKK